MHLDMYKVQAIKEQERLNLGQKQEGNSLGSLRHPNILFIITTISKCSCKHLSIASAMPYLQVSTSDFRSGQVSLPPCQTLAGEWTSVFTSPAKFGGGGIVHF